MQAPHLVLVTQTWPKTLKEEATVDAMSTALLGSESWSRDGCGRQTSAGLT